VNKRIDIHSNFSLEGIITLSNGLFKHGLVSLPLGYIIKVGRWGVGVSPVRSSLSIPSPSLRTVLPVASNGELPFIHVG
jgi:hypothetical protein